MEPTGQTFRTRDHQTIREWAQARDAIPATVPGTEHEGDEEHLGVLRLDFPDDGAENLAAVSWEEWFRTFDDRDLDFVYQETTRDGRPSNHYRLAHPEHT